MYFRKGANNFRHMEIQDVSASVNVVLKRKHTRLRILSGAVFMLDSCISQSLQIVMGYICQYAELHFICVLLGAVPGPESLLFSSPPRVPQVFPSTFDLLESSGPFKVNEVRKVCENSESCVHDTLASNMSDLGLLTLNAEKRFESLAVLFGECVYIPTASCVFAILLF